MKKKIRNSCDYVYDFAHSFLEEDCKLQSNALYWFIKNRKYIYLYAICPPYTITALSYPLKPLNTTVL